MITGAHFAGASVEETARHGVRKENENDISQRRRNTLKASKV